MFCRTEPRKLILSASEELYAMREKHINEQIKELKQIMKDHKKKFLKDPKNYGYSGDLSYVEEKLEVIEEHFSSYRFGRN